MIFKNRGFTLVEALVIIAIILTISVLTLVKYRSGQENYALAQSAQKLMADIRQAQGMALASAETSGVSKIGGYGVIIQSQSSYAVFLSTGSLSLPQQCRATADQQDIKTISLPSQIIFDSADVGKEVFFIPPAPRTCLNNTANQTEVVFTFKKIDLQNQKQVKVTRYGQIEIQ